MNEKRTLLFFVISFMIIFGWSYFQRYWVAKKPPLTMDTGRIKNVPLPDSNVSPAAVPSVTSSGTKVPSFTTGTQLEKEYVIQTTKARLVFTTRGAAIKHWYLLNNGYEYDLVYDSNTAPLMTSFSSSNFIPVRVDDTAVTFNLVTPEGILVTKEYRWENDALLLNLSFANLTVTEKRYTGEILNVGIALGTAQQKSEHAAPYRIITYQDKEKLITTLKKPGEYPQNYTWLGLDNRYYLLALVPGTNAYTVTTKVETVQPDGKTKLPRLAIYSSLTLARRSASALISYRIYGKAKRYRELEQIKWHNTSLRLEKAVDFGLFAPLSKLAWQMLGLFYRLTHNYGISIIVLTLVVQILVLPLTYKSSQSTAGLKKIQPLVDQLRIKYKTEPQRMQSEMLLLYKSHKVNPLGGCLPMLIQIPIFWALFNTLNNTYELQHAKFIGWIKDLSVADPYYVLPILMGLSMLIQQKVSGTTMSDPNQKIMGYIFPVVFTVMFVNFPAGLVLYWLVSNVVSIIVQMLITRKLVTEPGR